MSHYCFRFSSLGNYKKLGPPLSSTNFSVNSHEDNHFYKYIYLFQILYSMNSVFLLKHTLNFSNKSHGLKVFIEKKKIFSVDYVKIIELHVVHT